MPDPSDPPATAPADNIPTMSIRRDQPKGDGNKPAKLSYDDAVSKWVARGYPRKSAEGMADNVMRESGGDPTVIGDHGTSRGLFQEHDTRKDELEAYAKKQGKSPDDANVQFDFADQEIKTKFPTLYKQLMAGNDRGEAEDSFKRVFERPASVMWQNKPDGSGPALSSDRFGWSDYALNEHKGRPNTDVMMMDPQDYLDLTPDLEGSPFKSPSGRSLVKSVNNGDEVQSIPSLDMRVSGNTGTVTDQDGRHRALLAQQEGLDAIPVAVRKTGEGNPTEVQGMSGTILPFPSTKADAVPKSLWQKAANAVMSSAEAAEPPKNAIPVEGNPFAEDEAKPPPKNAIPVEGNPFADQAQGKPDGMAVSALKGAAAGLGNTILGGQELLGKGLEAASDMVSPPEQSLSGLVTGAQPQRGMVGRAGEWLVNDARKGLKTIDDATAADRKANPWSTWGGDMIGQAAIPGGAAKKLGGNALRMALTAGGLAGLLTPVGTDDEYWTSKGIQTGVGAATGAILDTAGKALAPWVMAKIGTPAYEFVSRLAGGDISKNKAALGIVRRMVTDQAAGGPTAQDMLDVMNAAPGKPLILGDVVGENALAHMGRLARTRGESRQLITKGLNDRDLGAGPRLVGDVDRGISPHSYHQAYDALDALRKRNAAPLYVRAYAKPPINPDHMAPNGVIGGLMGRPSVQQGMRNAINLAKEEGVNLTSEGVDLDAEGNPFFTPVLSWRALDYIKRGIDDVVEKYRNDTTGRLKLDDNGRAAQNTRRLFRNTLRSLNPELGAAYDAYSGPSASMGAMRAGKAFLGQDWEEVAQRVAHLPPGDREFYKLGTAQALRTAIGAKGLHADESKAILGNQNMRNRLRPLFNGGADYDRFIDSVQAEARMFATRHNILGGSQSAGRLAEDNSSPELEALSYAARGLHSAIHHNPLGFLSNLFRAVRPLNSMHDPKTDAEAARLLMSHLNDPATSARLNNFGQGLSQPPYARPNALTNIIMNRLGNPVRNALAAGLRGPAVAPIAGAIGANAMPTMSIPRTIPPGGGQ